MTFMFKPILVALMIAILMLSEVDLSAVPELIYIHMSHLTGE
jgi:hypothetical protein